MSPVSGVENKVIFSNWTCSTYYNLINYVIVQSSYNATCGSSQQAFQKLVLQFELYLVVVVGS